MRCRLILLITEHPIQQGIRKGGVRHFGHEDEDGRGRTDRMAYSRQLDSYKVVIYQGHCLVYGDIQIDVSKGETASTTGGESSLCDSSGNFLHCVAIIQS